MRVYRSEILGRLWARGEYLAWATKAAHLPPLVTASPPGTLPQDAGVIGLPDTTVLFGDENLFGAMRSGVRLTGGYWWTPAQMGGIEANYFEMDYAKKEGLFQSPANPLIARPFLNVNTGQQDSRLVAYPGVLDGAIAVTADTMFNGAELLLRHSVSDGLFERVYLVGGYRYARLADRLATREALLSLDASSGYDPGTLIDRVDEFQAINNFHGGEMGLIARWWRNRFSFQVSGKLALGATRTDVTIDGATATVATVGSQPVVTEGPGGVLALPTNIGRYKSGDFAAIGELGVSLDYAITCNLRASVGYNFLYWSLVGRASDQIDLGLNPTQFPPGVLAGSPRPQFNLNTTDFWAQGVTVGLEYQF